MKIETSIARRPVVVALLAMSLALSLIAATVETASAAHRRPIRRNSFAATFLGPNTFTCIWFEDEPVHDYICAGEDNVLFRLSDPDSERLGPGAEPANPDVVGFKGLAIPNRFRCEWTGDPAADTSQPRDAALFDCVYRHRHGHKGIKHTVRFQLSEAVLVTLEPDPESDQLVLWVLPHPKRRK
jgi:hypothetical protein